MDSVRDMTVTLKHKGVDVVAAAGVPEALRHIANENFDVQQTILELYAQPTRYSP